MVTVDLPPGGEKDNYRERNKFRVLVRSNNVGALGTGQKLAGCREGSQKRFGVCNGL